MAIDSDVEFDYVNKVVKRTAAAGATIYSTNALYSYIMDESDELLVMGGQVAMSAQTPMSYTIVKGWYIQEELTQYLDSGAIQTSGYTNEIHTVSFQNSGYTNCIASDLSKVVQDDGVNFGTLLDYDNTVRKWWVRTGGATVAASGSAMTIVTGAGAGTTNAASATGEHVFANPYTLGTLEGTPQLYIYQNGARVAEWWSTGHFDILIKVAESGIDIDSRDITVFGRHWTDEYTTFLITLTTSGQNPIPLGTKNDLGNQSTESYVEDLQDGTIANIAIDYSFAAPFSYDIGDGAGLQDYEVQIDCDGQRLSNVYEVVKYWCRTGSTKQLETGADAAFVNGEAYRFANISYAEVVVSPLGFLAGGKFFGARSVYLINLHADDVSMFQLIDKAGVTRDPPGDGGGSGWTDAEKAQLRDALGIDGDKSVAIGGQLQDLAGAGTGLHASMQDNGTIATFSVWMEDNGEPRTDMDGMVAKVLDSMGADVSDLGAGTSGVNGVFRWTLASSQLFPLTSYVLMVMATKGVENWHFNRGFAREN